MGTCWLQGPYWSLQTGDQLAKLKRSEVQFFGAAACDTGTHSGLCPQQGLSASKTQQNIAHKLGYPSRWVNFGIRTVHFLIAETKGFSSKMGCQRWVSLPIFLTFRFGAGNRSSVPGVPFFAWDPAAQVGGQSHLEVTVYRAFGGHGKCGASAQLASWYKLYISNYIKLQHLKHNLSQYKTGSTWWPLCQHLQAAIHWTIQVTQVFLGDSWGYVKKWAKLVCSNPTQHPSAPQKKPPVNPYLVVTEVAYPHMTWDFY